MALGHTQFSGRRIGCPGIVTNFLHVCAGGSKSYGDDMHAMAISIYHLGVLLRVLGKSGKKLLHLVITISTWLTSITCIFEKLFLEGIPA